VIFGGPMQKSFLKPNNQKGTQLTKVKAGSNHFFLFFFHYEISSKVSFLYNTEVAHKKPWHLIMARKGIYLAGGDLITCKNIPGFLLYIQKIFLMKLVQLHD